MRHYECECLSCGDKRQVGFRAEPYPEIGSTFNYICPLCGKETPHTRVLTRKAASELRCRERENELRNSIVKKCSDYGFGCRFLHRSIIVTTDLADWCFDYHESRITLYHESTVKVNFKTGDYAKSHVQFSGRKISPLDVITYIADHDAWRAKAKRP